MRLLIASHSYVLANARSKIRALSDLVNIALFVPDSWRFELVSAVTEPETLADLLLIRSPVFMSGHNIRYVYSPVRVLRALELFNPEIVLVEEEPSSLALAEFSLFQKRFGFPLVFFTWENIFQRPHLTRWIEEFNLGAAAGAIAGSQQALQVLTRKGFSKRVETLPQMGIDPHQFTPSRDVHSDTPFIIGYAGRIVEEKGLRVLFDAVRDLPGNWELHLVGDGPFRPILEQMAQQAGWSHRLRWLGYLPRDQMPTFYRRLNLFVLASLTRPRWKEQFGRVLIEAMACGVPVIGSNSGAIPEVIGNAEAIFPEGDSEALHDKMLALLESPDLRASLSARGVERVRMNYTDAIIARKLLAFLEAARC